ncbi:MAG: ROK family protein [Clostridia bacterium]|nr:ROK family protein [Clostridia bacterium]
MFDDGGKIKTGSQQLIKETNIRRVFKLVSKSNGISRAEIAGRTRLSPTTVSSLADELITGGYIMEDGTGEIPTSGRKPIILKVKADGGYIIATDLQENGYNLGLFNLNCIPINEKFIKLGDYEKLGESITKEIEKVLESNKILTDRLLGICIGAPGIIDRDEGRIISSTILPIDGRNDFYEKIKNAYPGIKIELINESSLSAYAEKEYSTATRDISNLLYIDVHTGIGAGIIINGRMYEGSGSLAGEFGHISVDINGPHCKCGNRGCLETLASIPALIADIEKDSGFPKEYPNAGSIEEKFSVIASEYVENNGFAGEIREMAKHLSYGINNAVNLLNPGAVVIGGKAAELGIKFINEIRRYIKKIGLEGNKETPILLSEFKGNPVTAGGARHIFNIIF